jgi:hypothetical protein
VLSRAAGLGLVEDDELRVVDEGEIEAAQHAAEERARPRPRPVAKPERPEELVQGPRRDGAGACSRGAAEPHGRAS